jgi:hypothetical protein
MKTVHTWLRLASIGALTGALCGCPTTPGQPAAPSPKLVDDFVLQNVPGSRDRAYAQDQLVEGMRRKLVWATIDPNNTFVTKVVVEWGDALASQTEAPLVLRADATPAAPNVVFDPQHPNDYATAPAPWGAELLLRGNGPDTQVPGNQETYTGIAIVDGLLNRITHGSPIAPRTVPAPGLPDGSFVQYSFHVTFTRSKDPGAQRFDVYLPLRTHVYGPNVSTGSPPSAFWPEQPRFEPKEIARQQTALGETFDVQLRLQRAVTRPTTFNFQSDPAGSLEVINENGQPISSTTVLPAPFSTQDPYLQHWKVRVKGPAGAVDQTDANRRFDPQLRQLWVHASGHAAGVLRVTGQ